MAKKKIRMIPYDSIEFYAVESWLTEQANKGWQLKTIRGNFAVFEDGIPRQTRFCLDTLNADKYGIEQELHETAAQQGWDYICDYAWHSYGVYRSDDPDAVPFHTDLSVRQSAMRRRMVLNLIGLALLALIIVYQFIRPDGLIAVLRGSAGSEFYLGNGLILMICSVLLFLFWAVFVLFSFGAFRRAKRDLALGMAGPHPSAALLTSCRLFLTICIIAVIALLLVGRQYGYGQSQFSPLPEQASLRVPLWQTIDAVEYQRAQQGIPDDRSFDDFMVIRHSPFTVEICSVRQAGSYHAFSAGSGVMESFYDVDDCVMRSVQSAERAFAMLAEESNCESLPPSNGFDEAAWGKFNTAQTMILRKDSTVIRVYYNGETDLREKIHLFADALSQGDGR